MLFAQAETLEWWIKTGVVYGLGFIVLAALALIFVWFVWKVAGHINAMIHTCRQELPPAIASHRKLLETLRESAEKHDDTNARTTLAVETLTETRRAHQELEAEKSRHLERLVESQAVILHTAKEIQSEVKQVVSAQDRLIASQDRLNTKLDSKSNDPTLLLAANTIELHDEDRLKPDNMSNEDWQRHKAKVRAREQSAQAAR